MTATGNRTILPFPNEALGSANLGGELLKSKGGVLPVFGKGMRHSHYVSIIETTLSIGMDEKVSIPSNDSRLLGAENGNMPKVTNIHTKNRRPSHVYLVQWLKHRNMTANALAARMDTSKSVISKLVNGEQRYNQDWLERIAWVLACEVQDLYRLPNQPTASELLAKLSPARLKVAAKVIADLVDEEPKKASSSKK